MQAFGECGIYVLWVGVLIIVGHIIDDFRQKRLHRSRLRDSVSEPRRIGLLFFQ